ncbi:MAG: hypothetical protein FWJ89_09825 [Limnochorda sp.]
MDGVVDEDDGGLVLDQLASFVGRQRARVAQSLLHCLNGIEAHEILWRGDEEQVEGAALGAGAHRLEDDPFGSCIENLVVSDELVIVDEGAVCAGFKADDLGRRRDPYTGCFRLGHQRSQEADHHHGAEEPPPPSLRQRRHRSFRSLYAQHSLRVVIKVRVL